MALLYPSDEEGYGLPPLEALWCGGAVISTPVPSLETLRGHPKLILISHPLAPSLQKALWKIVDVDSHGDRVVSFSAAPQRFPSWQECAVNTVSLYKTLLVTSSNAL